MASKERLYVNEDKSIAVIIEQHDNGNLEVSFAGRETYVDVWPSPTKLKEVITSHDVLRMT